jgi:hypothetical protein
MQRVQLNREPYTDLFCLVCGTQWSAEGRDEIEECEHLVHYGMDEDPSDCEDLALQESDICFEIFEAAPADRTHYFVLRP